ncbi:MAG: histidinol-phosphatase [Spirochaetaceae bacterium 4572_59]|nr:MAG: histidinol-phosphatase [Spirochaetaceae bacterium 4572_59]
MEDLSSYEILKSLNVPSMEKRLEACASLAANKELMSSLPPESDEVNNHVHTSYSFSPYSPSAAVWFAREAGLKAVGSMDHDSIAAARETLAAGKIFGVATTVGFEVRVNFTGTVVEGRKLNNPDSLNIVYMTVHGIPEDKIDDAAEFLKPIQKNRNLRNRKETEALNNLITPLGIEALDFDRDVYGSSEAAHGGSITERHILYALSQKIVEKAGKGSSLVSFLEEGMGITVSGKIREFLLDESNPHYFYDLLGILKGNFLGRFFIQPDTKECPSVYDVVRFANSIGAMPSYAYLGDVRESPTGDKKAEKFEDDFLDELIPQLKKIGFKAVTYMPPRNTLKQLQRVQKLCAENDLMEISGVDINSSRQSFNCPEILQADFTHLISSTWALIAHEKLAAGDARYGFFHPENPLAALSLSERIKRYGIVGEGMDRTCPEKLIKTVDF